MNYKVLYRKYRPDNFDNIIGQNYIISTLRNSVIHNNISHAYIFSGPRGTGKTSTAKVFAKAINCLNPMNGSPCGECDFCTNFVENPDIIEIDAASNNGVDEIRNLIDNIKLSPTNGRYKVYIIDEVHMLTTSAFNALLLTLEEPPSHTIFILATTNIENVPITILSRCQRFDFQKISNDDIYKRLKEICEIENISIDDDALEEIAYLAEGGMRDALSLLDQLSKNGQRITVETIEKEIKTVSQKNIKDLLTFIEDNEIEQCLALINDFRVRAIDYKYLVKKLIDQISKKAKNLKISGKKGHLNFDDYKKLIFELSDSLSKININVDSYTILEMILLDYFKTPKKVNIPEEEKVIIENDSLTSANDIDENFIKMRINNCFVNAQKGYLEEMKKLLEDYISNVSIEGKIKAILQDSQVVLASDKNLIFTCQNDHNVANANKSLEIIEKSLSKEIARTYKIIFISNERWNQEKKQYIENIKNKKNYTYITEQTANDEIEINEVFENVKVEII